jgi:uncharacterized caspase-like protein
VPASALERGRAGKLFVLAVGIDDFRDPFWPTLKWARADAAAVAKAFGKGTDREVVTTALTNEQATLAGVRKALQALQRAAGPQDAVAIYVSTHGTLDETDDGELERVVVLSDTTPSQPL